MRTPSPMTAINRMRKELDRLEALVRSRLEAKKASRLAPGGRRRTGKRKQQVCGTCGRPGHNARGHRRFARQRR